MFLSSQLAVLHGESVSVRTLQGTIQALEQEKANLQDRVQRLEKDLAAGPETVKASGKVLTEGYTANIPGNP